MPFKPFVQKILLSGGFVLCLFTGVLAQSVFKVHGGAIYAFNAEHPDFPEGTILADGGGCFGAIEFMFLKETQWFEPGVGLGIKQLYTSGSAGPYEFTSRSTRLFTIAYGHFLIAEKWKAGPVVLVENNKDFTEFLPNGSDHFRYNAGLSVGYDLNKRFEMYLRYFRSIFPNANFYLIKNPSDQLTLGVTFKFFTL